VSLSGTIQLAANSLLAQQIGLQVTGNNIANASTPGYLRQRVNFVPAATQERGTLRFGTGVTVDSITVETDRFVSERNRRATSDVSAAEPQETTYLQLEALLGELGDADLSSTLDRFFASLQTALTEPDNAALRNNVLAEGEAVATELNRLDHGIDSLRKEINSKVVTLADDVNRLVSDIARFNAQIVTLEGGGAIRSDAVGVRDRREIALNELLSVPLRSWTTTWNGQT